MEAGIDYKFRDDLWNKNDEGSTVPIELMLDPFAGVCYRYTTVKFRLGEDDIPRLQYDYEILKTNELSMVTLRKNQKFNEVLGLILNAMLLDLGDAGEAEIGASNTKESNSEGGLHKEGPSVSEG